MYFALLSHVADHDDDFNITEGDLRLVLLVALIVAVVGIAAYYWRRS